MRVRTAPGQEGTSAQNIDGQNRRSSPSNSTHWTDGKTEAQHIQNQDQSPSSTSCPQGHDQPADFKGRGHLGLKSVCVRGQVPGTGKAPGQQAHNFASARVWVQPTGPTPAQGLGGAITTGQGQGPGQALALPPLLSGRPTYQRGLRAQCAGRGPEGWLSTSEAFLSRPSAPTRGHGHPRKALLRTALRLEPPPQPGQRVRLGWPPPSACPTPSAHPGSAPTQGSPWTAVFPLFKIKETPDTQETAARDTTRDKRSSEETKKAANTKKPEPKMQILQEMKGGAWLEQERRFLKGDI